MFTACPQDMEASMRKLCTNQSHKRVIPQLPLPHSISSLFLLQWNSWPLITKGFVHQHTPTSASPKWRNHSFIMRVRCEAQMQWPQERVTKNNLLIGASEGGKGRPKTRVFQKCSFQTGDFFKETWCATEGWFALTRTGGCALDPFVAWMFC